MNFVLLIGLALIILISGRIGYNIGVNTSKNQPAPSEEAWIQAKKYQLDKEWQYILKLHEEERNGKKDQC